MLLWAAVMSFGFDKRKAFSSVVLASFKKMWTIRSSVVRQTMIPSSYQPIGSDSPSENDENFDPESEEASQQSKWRKAIQRVRKADKSFLVSKAFYFFFYTALGSLFPFFSLFYKQLWLTPGQIGLLLALRPAVKLVCLPLWKMVTDRFSKPKDRKSVV